MKLVLDEHYQQGTDEFKVAEMSKEMPLPIYFFPRRIFSRVQEYRFPTETWKESVLELFSESDVAIIDVTEITENVRWEIRQTSAHLPVERVLVIARWRQWEPFEELLRCDKTLTETVKEDAMA